MTAPVTAPAPNRTEAPDKIPSIGAKVLADFNNSYRFSQGDADLQGQIYRALRAIYVTTLPEEDRRTIVKILPFLQKRVLRFALPKEHQRNNIFSSDQEIDAADRGISPQAEAFREEWGAFSSNYLHFLDDPEITEGMTLEHDTVLNIAAGMATRDKLYQHGKGRPSRREGSDPHASMFREYVLGGKPTGSSAFDLIFAAARAELDDPNNNYYRQQVSMLAPEWEKNHPGQTFLPPAPEQ